MEPKYLSEEVIIHPNHPQSSSEKVIGSLGMIGSTYRTSLELLLYALLGMAIPSLDQKEDT